MYNMNILLELNFKNLSLTKQVIIPEKDLIDYLRFLDCTFNQDEFSILRYEYKEKTKKINNYDDEDDDDDE